MKITCKVIRDLLPLYHDDVCSDDSKVLVEEHLANCQSCKEELRRIESELSLHHVSPEVDGAKKAISSAWKSAKKKSYIRGAIISAIVCAMLVGAFVGLTEWKIIPAKAETLKVTELSQLPDGSITFRMIVDDNKNLFFVKYSKTDDGCLYVTPMHSIIETSRKYDIGLFDEYYVFNISGDEHEPQYAGTAYFDGVTKIYVGPVGKGTLVWEAGMALPNASDDVKKILTMN